MDTQITPIHDKLWHKDFWLVAIACFMIEASVYMLMTISPWWMASHFPEVAHGRILPLAMPQLAAFVFGIITSWLLRCFRRKTVCFVMLIVMGAMLLMMSGVIKTASIMSISQILLLRFIMGACYGLAMMILNSSVIMDVCESFHRTEANHSLTWIWRFAMAIGPTVILIFRNLIDDESLIALIAPLPVLSAILILFVNLPFKAPDESNTFLSLDRFFLPLTWPVALLLLITMTSTGIVLITSLPSIFFVFMMIGFMIVVLGETRRMLLPTLPALLIIAIVPLLLLLTPNVLMTSIAAGLLTGIGVGSLGSRMLMSFVNLSDHCQRGTAQSTFFLSWETGVGLGIVCKYAIRLNTTLDPLIIATLLAAAGAILYILFIRKWYINNKKREYNE